MVKIARDLKGLYRLILSSSVTWDKPLKFSEMQISYVTEDKDETLVDFIYLMGKDDNQS